MRCLLCGEEPEEERCAILVAPQSTDDHLVAVVVCVKCMELFEERSFLIHRRDLLSLTGAPEFKLSLS